METLNIDKITKSKRVLISFPEMAIDKDFVKEFRAKHNLTQSALANILGVKKKTVEKWEQGINKVGGSSAVLLGLLENNPELIVQLYDVQIVRGNPH